MDNRKTNYITGKLLEEQVYNSVSNNQIFYNLFDVLNIFTETPYNIKKYGGRKYIYDFMINSNKVEIKNNSDSIFKLPEILQLSCSSLQNDNYIKYYYDNYIEHDSISFDNYKKGINNFSKRNEFFQELYKNKETLKSNVLESIEKYIISLTETELKKIVDEIIIKIKEQTEKHFILFKNETFYYNKIEDNFIIKNIIKNKNNIKIETEKYIYCCLLRWKNGIGVNLPCYQISIIKNNNINEPKLSKLEKRKNGIYFTPTKIINNIIEKLKLINNVYNDILEPSFGKGDFLNNLNVLGKHIEGYEINKKLFDFVNKNNRNFILHNEDYLTSTIDKKYDLIIGNPPYFVNKKSKLYNEYYTGRPNIFIQFIIHSLLKLKDNGILCFVLPITFLNCLYYRKTRDYIKTNFKIIEIFENDDLFTDTKYKTITIIIQNNKENDNNVCLSQNILTNKNFVYNDVFVLKQISINDKCFKLSDLDIKLSIGNFVWNQHKNIITNDSTKPILIYRPNNKIRRDYINTSEKKYIHDKNIIIINRGYGNTKYKFNYELINSSDYPNGFIIENHNIIIEGNNDVLTKIINSFSKEKTHEFINNYITNGAMNLNDLKNNIMLFE